MNDCHQDPERPRKPATQPRAISMAVTAGTRPEDPVPTGVVHLIHALAFSTLLSSQETDAHRQVRFRFPVGATLKLYPRGSCVSTSFPEAFRKVADCRSLRPQASGLQGLRARAVAPEASCLVAPRVPSRLAAFRPPRGKKNSTGSENPRQIGGCTHLPHHL